MELRSQDFEPKGTLPAGCSCDGEDRRPELHWSGIPDGTAELALTCEDVDAPGGTFVHWVIWGLDPAMAGLGADLPDDAAEGVNDFENIGYGGPCPPPGHGYHHYHFRLYALSDQLKLAPGGHDHRDAPGNERENARDRRTHRGLCPLTSYSCPSADTAPGRAGVDPVR